MVSLASSKSDRTFSHSLQLFPNILNLMRKEKGNSDHPSQKLQPKQIAVIALPVLISNVLYLQAQQYLLRH
jgi:hypothetical protein